MDLVRFGVVIRALRRRRGWRQSDLGAAAGVSQTLVSLVERGHADRVVLAHVMAVVAALEARFVIDVRWRGGELDRLLDGDHAALSAVAARMLTDDGWEARFEVTYAVHGANGSIDIVAWHADTRSVLVVEIKTEITSAEATIRKLDEKVRLAAGIVLDRFRWRAASVSRLLVVERSTTARQRVLRAGLLFDTAFPVRGVHMRRWLRAPAGSVAALMFVPNSSPSTGTSQRGRRHRVRRGGADVSASNVNVNRPRASDRVAVNGSQILRNWT